MLAGENQTEMKGEKNEHWQVSKSILGWIITMNFKVWCWGWWGKVQKIDDWEKWWNLEASAAWGGTEGGKLKEIEAGKSKQIKRK